MAKEDLPEDVTLEHRPKLVPERMFQKKRIVTRPQLGQGCAGHVWQEVRRSVGAVEWVPPRDQADRGSGHPGQTEIVGHGRISGFCSERYGNRWNATIWFKVLKNHFGGVYRTVYSVESHKLQVSEGTFIVYKSHLDKAEFTKGLPLAAGFRTDARGQDGGRGLVKALQGSRQERWWPSRGRPGAQGVGMRLEGRASRLCWWGAYEVWGREKPSDSLRLAPSTPPIQGSTPLRCSLRPVGWVGQTRAHLWELASIVPE